MNEFLTALFISKAIIFSTTPIEVKTASPELYCLVQNIYFESGNQSYAGKVAVAEVTLNRVKTRKYPSTICGVVKQAVMSKWWKEKYDKNVPVRNKCQFSWFCDGKSDEIKYLGAWKSSMIAAHDALNSKRKFTEGALYYHANYVNPRWNKQKEYITQIGDHIFYR